MKKIIKIKESHIYEVVKRVLLESEEVEITKLKKEKLGYGKGSIYYYNEEPFNGIAIEKFPNGKTKTSTTYVEGIQDGKTIWYYENGKVSMEGDIIKGNKHGDITAYYPSGNIEAIFNYNNGNLKKVTQYNEEGEITKVREPHI